MKILGIETSADDTGIALIDASGEFGSDFSCKIIANAVGTQTMHAGYGGIYPNLAKSEHSRNLPLLLDKVLEEGFGITRSQIQNPKQIPNHKSQKQNLDAIAVTVGPGLEPCLWTGINFAQELAKKWNVPVVPVNHMEGHIIVSLARNEEGARDQVSGVSPKTYSLEPITCPAIALLISGGHTELILMRSFPGRTGAVYEYIGRTRDDAVGEAFDKVARMIGLPYPGGPAISALAEIARNKKQETNIKLPRPMLNEKNLDFSFSGLKTAVLRLVEAEKNPSTDFKREIARAFEDAAAEVLVEKTFRAAEEFGVNTVVVGGGVSANKYIRSELDRRLSTVNCKLLLSPLEFTGDNAVMIALAGYFHALKKEFAEPDTLRANGDLSLA